MFQHVLLPSKIFCETSGDIYRSVCKAHNNNGLTIQYLIEIDSGAAPAAPPG